MVRVLELVYHPERWNGYDCVQAHENVNVYVSFYAGVPELPYHCADSGSQHHGDGCCGEVPCHHHGDGLVHHPYHQRWFQLHFQCQIHCWYNLAILEEIIINMNKLTFTSL